MSLFGLKPQGQSRSMLYVLGRGSGKIYWFWELDLNSRYYREFQAVGLAAGENVYREENFESWESDDEVRDR